MNYSAKARFNQTVLAAVTRLLGRRPKVNDRVHVIIQDVDLTFRVYRDKDGKVSMHCDCPVTVTLPAIGEALTPAVVIYAVTKAESVA